MMTKTREAAAARIAIERANERLVDGNKVWSSYSDALVDLADGDQVHLTRSCTLITVAGVEHRDGGLIVWRTTVATEFLEAPRKTRPARRPRKAARFNTTTRVRLTTNDPFAPDYKS